MKEKLRTIISLFLISCLLVPIVGAAYILRNDGTISIDSGSLYINGMTVTDYIDSRALAMSGFDQSLNTTDDVEFNSVTLSGVQRNTWPSASGNHSVSTATYIVYDTGVYYLAVDGTTGSILSNNTDAVTVINAAAAALPTTLDAGVVYLRAGTYTINTGAITIGEKTHLIGEGAGSTVLDVTGNVNCIQIDSCSGDDANWAIEGITIDMNSNTGHAIYAPYAHSTGVIYSFLRDLYIHSVAADYCGIYLIQPMSIVADGIRIKTAGTGLKLETLGSPNINWGNSMFKEIRVGLMGINATGFNFTAFDGTHNINLCEFHRLQVVSGDYSGTMGLYAKNIHYSSFYELDIEEAKTCIKLEGVKQLNFYGGWFGKGAYNIDTVLQLEHACQSVNFYGCRFNKGSGGTSDIVDNHGGVYYYVTLDRCESPLTTFTGTLTGAVRISNMIGWDNLQGVIATPFTTFQQTMHGAARYQLRTFSGDAAAPTASREYVATQCGYIINSTGGAASITIKNAKGETIASGLTTLTAFYLPAGYRINFGAFGASPPTVIVSSLVGQP